MKPSIRAKIRSLAESRSESNLDYHDWAGPRLDQLQEVADQAEDLLNELDDDDAKSGVPEHKQVIKELRAIRKAADECGGHLYAAFQAIERLAESAEFVRGDVGQPELEAAVKKLLANGK